MTNKNGAIFVIKTGWRAISYQWVEIRDSGKHPRMHTTVPYKKELLVPNVNTVRIENSNRGKWMELEIMLNEISQDQKDKYCLFSLICRI
jgi:hypothetical protein